MNSSAADCPLSYAGITVYATIDVGLGYSSNGAPASGTYSNSVYSFVGKQSYGAKWLWTPNGISQSVVGINMKEAIPWLPGWSLVGAVETGFDPYSGDLVNGPRSLVQNNGLPLVLQSANSDSSRAGQFDNSVGYIGLSNKTFGTLTVGRVTSLTLDGVIAYDPMGGSYAFSALGYSGSYAGFGDTETNRANTGVKYRVAYENFHGGALVQWGGYAQGNGTTGLYQGDIGADIEGLRRPPVAGRRRQLRSERGQPLQFRRRVLHAHQGPLQGSDRLHQRDPELLRSRQPESDALQQQRSYAARQVQMGPGDALRRLDVVAASQSQRRLFERLSDPRRL